MAKHFLRNSIIAKYCSSIDLPTPDYSRRHRRSPPVDFDTQCSKIILSALEQGCPARTSNDSTAKVKEFGVPNNLGNLQLPTLFLRRFSPAVLVGRLLYSTRLQSFPRDPRNEHQLLRGSQIADHSKPASQHPDPPIPFAAKSQPNYSQIWTRRRFRGYITLYN